MTHEKTIRVEINRWTSAALLYQRKGAAAYENTMDPRCNPLTWQSIAAKEYALARFYMDAITSVEEYARQNNALTEAKSRL